MGLCLNVNLVCVLSKKWRMEMDCALASSRSIFVCVCACV